MNLRDLEYLVAVADHGSFRRAAAAWQAARSLGDFTLVSCSVAPEFRFEGFRLLADDPLAQAEWPWLVEQHPELL